MESIEALGVVDAVVSTPSRKAFALKVEGMSMVSPHGPSFPPGTEIVVDPDVPWTDGCFVVALDGQARPTFRRLVQDSGRWYLRPLDTSYPTSEIDDPAKSVIGRVIEQIYRSAVL